MDSSKYIKERYWRIKEDKQIIINYENDRNSRIIITRVMVKEYKWTYIIWNIIN